LRERFVDPLNISGESQLVLVRHGVSLNPIRLHEDFGCQVIMRADDVPVDLTLLQPRQGPLVEARLGTALEELQAAAKTALWELPPATPGSNAPHFAEPEVSFALRTGCGVLGFLLLFVQPFVGIGMLSAASRGGTPRRIRIASEAQKRWLSWPQSETAYRP